MALRKSVLDAVLRVARLREQQAAAQAQRERKRLLDALSAATQLDQFAAEYRNDLSRLMQQGESSVGLVQNTFEFSRRLEATAEQQRETSEPLKELVVQAGKVHQSYKLRLDGLEKIERMEKRRALQELFARESRETEDSVSSRLFRRAAN
jgi:flagellar biosynthesis chaperone FliJ